MLKEAMKHSGRVGDQSPPIFRDFSTHASRTMMLSELSLLLEGTQENASPQDYSSAVLYENVLLKGATTTRNKSLRHLRELYALIPEDPLFGALRTLWLHDPPGRPLLALLCAVSRDALLRSTAELILETSPGSPVDARMLSEAVTSTLPDRLIPSILAKVGRNTASSWTQSGHLEGRTHKVRVRAEASVGSVVYALLLGHLSGVRGLPLYETLWARLLDLPPNEIDALAFAASQRGLLEYRRMGEVAEFGFSQLLSGNRG